MSFDKVELDLKINRQRLNTNSHLDIITHLKFNHPERGPKVELELSRTIHDMIFLGEWRVELPKKGGIEREAKFYFELTRIIKLRHRRIRKGIIS